MSRDARGRRSQNLEVRFCGGCNPSIDRIAVADEVRSQLDSNERAEATLFISGCQRACASQHQLRTDDRAAVVVAGEYVDGRPAAAPRISVTVMERLRACRGTAKG